MIQTNDEKSIMSYLSDRARRMKNTPELICCYIPIPMDKTRVIKISL